MDLRTAGTPPQTTTATVTVSVAKTDRTKLSQITDSRIRWHREARFILTIINITFVKILIMMMMIIIIVQWRRERRRGRRGEDGIHSTGHRDGFFEQKEKKEKSIFIGDTVD